MALTLYEAAKRSQNKLTRGIFLAIATSDQMLAKLRMERQANGESLIYTREATISDPAFVAPDHASIAEGTGTDDRVTVPLRILAGDADTYLFAEEQMSELESQMARQLRMKLKGTGRVIAAKAITGGFATSFTVSEAASSPGLAVTAAVPNFGQDTDRHGPASLKYTHVGTFWSYRAPGDRTYGTPVAIAANGSAVLSSDNPSRKVTITVTVASATADGEVQLRFASTTNEPDGLLKLIPTSQVISSSGANGDALSFDILDQLIDELVKTRDDLAFVGNAKLKRKFMALLRSAGGLTGAELALPGINGPVPTYRGIPFLQNDNIPSTEAKGGATTLSSLMLLDFGDQGFFAGCGGAGEGALSELTPTAVRIMGVRVRNIGELEAKEAMRQRVTWYGAFGLRSDLSVGRAKEIVTA